MRSTDATWTGWRFARIHITPDHLRNAVDDVNRWCAHNRGAHHCDAPMSGDPADWVIVRHGALLEFWPVEGYVATSARIGWLELYREVQP